LSGQENPIFDNRQIILVNRHIKQRPYLEFCYLRSL